MQSGVNRVVQHTLSDHIGAFDSISHIPYMTIGCRKTLLTICRVQSYPRRGTKVYDRLRSELDAEVHVPPTSYQAKPQVILLRDILVNLEEMITSPYLSGLISMLVRNIGYHSLDSVEETFEAGLEKEISAAVEVYRPRILNWHSILSHDPSYRHRTKIDLEYTYDSHLGDSIYASLLRARSRISGMTIYPQYSKKTIGKAACKIVEWALATFGLEAPDDPYSTETLEVLYHKYGLILDGPTELRWAWKFNDLKPRIYYARGPDVYYDSRYVQPIFNLLIDALPQCHRRARYDIASLALGPRDRFFIYDYRSFTSALDEIRNFTAALADFMRGVQVTVIDTLEGPADADVGEILDRYNETCNNAPSFDVGYCNWDRKQGGESCIISHTCGMLGVPGNISSCTLLHAIHLILTLEHLGCKVVGDDAGGFTLKGPNDILDKLKNIGDVNAEKVESWDESVYQYETELPPDSSWHYTKRPIDRVEDRVYAGFQAVWPPLALVLDLTDQFHTTPPHLSGHDSRDRAVKYMRRFVAQMSTFPVGPKEWEIEIMDRFLKSIRMFKIIPKERDRYFDSFYHTPSSVRLGLEPDLWLDEIWDDVRCVDCLVDEAPLPFDRFRINSGPMSKALKLAIDLGYAQADLKKRWIQVSQDPDFFRRLILHERHPRPVAYTFSVYDSAPPWLVKLIMDSYAPDPIIVDDQLPYPYVDDDEVDWEI